MKKNKKVFPDEVYDYGTLRLARFGNKVLMESKFDKEAFEERRKKLAAEYPTIINEINKLVLEIRELVSLVDPLNLLHNNYFKYVIETGSIKSEHSLSEEHIISQRMIDYIQSIIAATPINETNEQITQDYVNNLKEKLTQLYRLLATGYLYAKTSHEQLTNPEYDQDFDSIYVQALMHWTSVRGNRYLIHNIPHLTDLFLPHEDIFQEVFSTSVKEFLQGLEKIQDSLTRGISEARNDLSDVLSEFKKQDIDISDSVSEKFIKRFEEFIIGDKNKKDKFRESFNKLFSYDLFDVGKITGWTEKLLRELSYAPGENTEFFQKGNFCGWPLRIEPIRTRPFLFINDKYYCFDVISLMDNIYRIVQKTIKRLSPAYENKWNDKQKEVSETLPIQLLKDILPGATSYESVYFRWLGTDGVKKDWQETDGLVIFDDHLFVIEVKGGAFTYTSPANDFDAYIQSIKNLLLKPAQQGKRFIDYLMSEDSVNLFDKDHNKIGELSKNDFRNITACSITIDNFTTLASQAKNLTPLGIDIGGDPLWSLSIDDLRVYKEIFTSPYVFLHYIEERKRASVSEYVDTNDELDHIGLYLKHNAYVSYAKDLSVGVKSRIVWNGYREDIDLYINSLYNRRGEVPRPSQDMLPAFYSSIIEIASYKKGRGYAKAIAILLNHSGEERERINDRVDYLLERQASLKRPLPLSSWYDESFVIFGRQNEFEYPDYEWILNYVYQGILLSGREEVLAIILDYENRQLVDADFVFVKSEDISEEKKIEIEPILNERFESMKKNYLRDKGKKKLGRNDDCPCCSGKKYKNCHGK